MKEPFLVLDFDGTLLDTVDLFPYRYSPNGKKFILDNLPHHLKFFLLPQKIYYKI